MNVIEVNDRVDGVIESMTNQDARLRLVEESISTLISEVSGLKEVKDTTLDAVEYLMKERRGK